MSFILLFLKLYIIISYFLIIFWLLVLFIFIINHWHLPLILLFFLLDFELFDQLLGYIVRIFLLSIYFFVWWRNFLKVYWLYLFLIGCWEWRLVFKFCLWLLRKHVWVRIVWILHLFPIYPPIILFEIFKIAIFHSSYQL